MGELGEKSDKFHVAILLERWFDVEVKSEEEGGPSVAVFTANEVGLLEMKDKDRLYTIDSVYDVNRMYSDIVIVLRNMKNYINNPKDTVYIKDELSYVGDCIHILDRQNIFQIRLRLSGKRLIDLFNPGVITE